MAVRQLLRITRTQDTDVETVIDLRDGAPTSSGAPSAPRFGYDALVPPEWQRERPQVPVRSLERPTPATTGSLPARFRLLHRFPALQRVVHHGPIDGRPVAIKLTIAKQIVLHSTGIEHPITDLDGRLRDHELLQVLIDSFGRDRQSLGSRIDRRPRTLLGAKREWHQQIMASGRHGFAIDDDHLVLLEYVPPERDARRRNFGIAYKRIVMAYAIEHG